MSAVAVLGAGFQGVCVALELARRGIDVDLFDRHDSCITQAGLRNEGKIHLGFVYSNDPSFATTRLLVAGALAFDRALRCWLEGDLEALWLSTPHYYAVHRDSLLAPDRVLAHFARVHEHIREVARIDRLTYLGRDVASLTFDTEPVEAAYDPEAIAAAIRTDERAVDVTKIALRLRARVAADPGITFHPATEIAGARRTRDGISVDVLRGRYSETRTYRQVVNCLWDGRLAVDRDMGIAAPHESLFRVKYSVTLAMPGAVAVPSTTFVVGPFGDIVSWESGRVYLSWYPVAKTAMVSGLQPPVFQDHMDGPEARRMTDATLDAFARLVPAMRTWPRERAARATVAGGVIVAAGSTDIDDPWSRLHTRTMVGVHSSDGYHSVDPGKYTMAPLFATEVAARVCGVPALS